MRWENINWDDAFHFNPRGKTRKARRVVPLSACVIALLRSYSARPTRPKRGLGISFEEIANRLYRTERARTRVPEGRSASSESPTP
jgi:hypothetical protein